MSADNAITITYSAAEVSALKHGNDILKDAQGRAAAQAKAEGRALLPGKPSASRPGGVGDMTVSFPASPPDRL